MQSIAETCVRFDAAHLSINLVSEIAVPMFTTLNVNITSILIVTFANGLGLTDDVCVNAPAYACMRAIKGLTTSTPQLFPRAVYKSLLVARLHEERERLVAQALAIASR